MFVYNSFLSWWDILVAVVDYILDTVVVVVDYILDTVVAVVDYILDTVVAVVDYILDTEPLVVGHVEGMVGNMDCSLQALEQCKQGRASNCRTLDRVVQIGL